MTARFAISATGSARAPYRHFLSLNVLRDREIAAVPELMMPTEVIPSERIVGHHQLPGVKVARKVLDLPENSEIDPSAQSVRSALQRQRSATTSGAAI